MSYELSIKSCSNGQLIQSKIEKITDTQIFLSAVWQLGEYSIPEKEMTELFMENSPPTMNLKIVFQFENGRKIPINDSCYFEFDSKYQTEEMRGGMEPFIFLDCNLGPLKRNKKNIRINSTELRGFDCELCLQIPDSLQTDADFQLIFGDIYDF